MTSSCREVWISTTSTKTMKLLRHINKREISKEKPLNLKSVWNFDQFGKIGSIVSEATLKNCGSSWKWLENRNPTFLLEAEFNSGFGSWLMTEVPGFVSCRCSSIGLCVRSCFIFTSHSGVFPREVKKAKPF